jgi:hypothetical protein
MNGGVISYNETTSSWDGGGGVYVDLNGASYTMNSGTISNNTAAYTGGGVYIKSGTFTMNGGTISGNIATSGGGGGVSVFTGTPYSRFVMKGGTIYGNTGSPGASLYKDAIDSEALWGFGTYHTGGDTSANPTTTATTFIVGNSTTLGDTNDTLTASTP